MVGNASCVVIVIGATMVMNMGTIKKESSQIWQFLNGTSVFLTGATGFLGKILLEKLLRTCTGIEKIYVLVREKRGKNPEKRLVELLDNIFFDRIKKEQPDFANKIVLITGDCVLPNLGIKNADKEMLVKEVGCVIHCAATVRFDEHIRKAVYINVRATRDILKLSREMKHLKSFVYVSTAYSNCIRRDINEEFYDVPISGEKLITLVDTLNENILAEITPTLINKWPNTYAFTKAVAENVVQVEGKGLPVAIVRPSIVIGCAKEPIPGWIDNLLGATGVFVGAGLGVLRTLHCNPKCLADMTPADFVINCTIAALWKAGNRRTGKAQIPNEGTIEEQEKNEIQIYNYVSSVEKPMTWKEVNDLAEKHLKQIPSPLMVWHHCFTMNTNYYVHMIYVIFLHRLPAYVVDFLARCIGKEPVMVKGYQKIEKFMGVLSYFATNQWNFKNDNTRALWNKLNTEDREHFDFDMSALDWDSFFYSYCRGGRVYLLKDPLDTLPQGRIKYRTLQIAHYVLVGLLLLGLLKLFIVLWNLLM